VESHLTHNANIMDAQVATTTQVPPAADFVAADDLHARRRFTRRFSAHRGIWATAVLTALAAAGMLWSYLRPDMPTTYVTEPVTRGTVAPYITASGAVNPVTTVQVGTYVSGVIQELRCDFNTRVHKNQLCAQIDPRPYQTVVDEDSANLATARAQLGKDEANLALSKLTFERNRELLRLDSVSHETLDNAESAYSQAQSQIAFDKAAILQHQAALRAARINLEYTRIVSPVDGTVVSRNVTQGQTVAASFQTPTLFIIATDLTQMQVDANVSEADIGEVALGDESSFTVEAFPGREFRGRVVQVRQAPQSVQNVVTYDVIVAVANAELLLKPGMTAAARIVSRRHDNVLRVPERALRYQPTALTTSAQQHRASSEIWVLREGKPVAVPVGVGLNDESYAEITRGSVSLNDPIIVSEHSSATDRRAPVPGQLTSRVPRL